MPKTSESGHISAAKSLAQIPLPAAACEKRPLHQIWGGGNTCSDVEHSFGRRFERHRGQVAIENEPIRGMYEI